MYNRGKMKLLNHYMNVMMYPSLGDSVQTEIQQNLLTQMSSELPLALSVARMVLIILVPIPFPWQRFMRSMWRWEG